MTETGVLSIDVILLLARLCLCATFLVSGIHKALYFEMAREEFRNVRIPLPDFCLVLVIGLHLFASVGIATGLYFQASAYALAGFMVAVTLWVRDFWNHPPDERLGVSRDFLANLAILGGLLFAGAIGPGAYVLF